MDRDREVFDDEWHNSLSETGTGDAENDDVDAEMNDRRDDSIWNMFTATESVQVCNICSTDVAHLYSEWVLRVRRLS